MKHRLRIIITLLLLLLSARSWAILHLVLTRGVDSAIPVAIVPFAKSALNNATNVTPLTNITDVVAADLQNSGRFSAAMGSDLQHAPHQPGDVQIAYWQKQNVNYLLVGSISDAGNGQDNVKFSLLDVYKRNKMGANPELANQAMVLMSQMLTVPATQIRALAHHISDLIYQKILGEPSVFSTKIAYVLLKRVANKKPVYKLMVADYDGFNPQPILISHQPIMSPAWSPDGQKIAYVSFEGGFPAIYISNIVTGKRRLITQFSGINGAPAFSPDGNRLAVVLSMGRQPNIYIVNLITKKLRKVTHSFSINTEPSWAPDGKSLIFTSDRGGSPQIYEANLRRNKIKRVTFSGNYNAHASFSPNGNTIVLLHRGTDTDQQFGVALQDVATGAVQVLADNNDQSPSLAPNGSMVIYARQNDQRHGELAMVSTDGRVKLQLPAAQGDVREPVWSPFLGKNN